MRTAGGTPVCELARGGESAHQWKEPRDIARLAEQADQDPFEDQEAHRSELIAEQRSEKSKIPRFDRFASKLALVHPVRPVEQVGPDSQEHPEPDERPSGMLADGPQGSRRAEPGRSRVKGFRVVRIANQDNLRHSYRNGLSSDASHGRCPTRLRQQTGEAANLRSPPPHVGSFAADGSGGAHARCWRHASSNRRPRDLVNVVWIEEPWVDIAMSLGMVVDTEPYSVNPLGLWSEAIIMRITWYGHAAFLIETQGLRIILDPYRSPDSGGYLPIDEPADLVVVSHENDRYHSHLGQIVPPFEVVRRSSCRPRGGNSRASASRPCTSSRPPSGCPKTRSRSSTSGPRACTWSSSATSGHPLTEEELAPLRGAEVVLAAAGGPPTIDFPEIPALLDAIGPRLVLPMHYKTPKINLNIQPLERFLEALPGDPVVRAGSSSMEITRDSLPEQRTIVVLEHGGDVRTIFSHAWWLVS